MTILQRSDGHAWVVRHYVGGPKTTFDTYEEAVEFEKTLNQEAEEPMEEEDAIWEGNLWEQSRSSEEEEAGEEAWQEVDDEQ